MSEWQPIETAPRNGTEIIAWGPCSSGPAVYVWGGQSRRWQASHEDNWVIESESDFGTEYKYERADALTLWQPLPPTPPRED